MDDAFLVRLLEGLGDLPGDPERLTDGDGTPLQALGEVLAFDELEDEKGLAVGLLEPVDRCDVRMVEGGEEVGLALEAGEALGVARDLGRENLDRHLPAELGVGGPVDLSHPPGSEGSQDLVETEACSRRQCHAAALQGVERWAGYYSILEM